jgi:hypothetical protein
MRIFLMISAAALIAGGALPAQACRTAQASAAQASTIELAAATTKKKTAKKPAKKKKEKIEYMRATG